MLAELLNSYNIYPPLSARSPLPALYLPLGYSVLILGYVLGPGSIRGFAISSALLLLALQRPRFTAGDVVQDYCLSGVSIVFLLNYLDHGTAGGGPRYFGRADHPLPRPVGREDNRTWAQKLKWSLSLTATVRGIGWGWQVKGVPAHPNAEQSRFRFVVGKAVEVVWRTALKGAAVYVLGFCRVVAQASGTAPLTGWLLDSVACWCVVVWSFNTIGAANAAGAAVTVLLGVCEPWAWPPVFGDLGTAWSVRQAWGTTYHQQMRRTFQQPGIRLARLLGFKKGSFSSRYLQLYSAFFISFATHWFQSYTVSRSDQGEFAFFMAQPVVISIEDFVAWVWKRSVAPKQRRRRSLAWLELYAGYVWTIAAFTITVRPIMRGWTDTGMVGSGGPDEVVALRLGSKHGATYFGG